MNRNERRRYGVTNNDWCVEVPAGSPVNYGDRVTVPGVAVINGRVVFDCKLGDETPFVVVPQRIAGQLRIIAPSC